MNIRLFGLYSDYLPSPFAAMTATGMSALMDKAIGPDYLSALQQASDNASVGTSAPCCPDCVT